MNQPQRRALRLCLITDGRGELASLLQLVQQALAGGVRAVQLREPMLTARQLGALGERLLPLVDAVQGVLLVNDRVDVAAAGLCHGVQLGHRSLPTAAARAALRHGELIGCSVHQEDELQRAAEDGADFALLAPVLPTGSKPGVPHLGIERAGQWTATAPLPVLWLGGFHAANLDALGAVPAASRPLGIAVRSAICSAADPAAAARRLCQELQQLGW